MTVKECCRVRARMHVLAFQFFRYRLYACITLFLHGLRAIPHETLDVKSVSKSLGLPPFPPPPATSRERRLESVLSVNFLFPVANQTTFSVCDRVAKVL